MSGIDPLFLQKEWRFVDHSSLGLHYSALKSFAYDDTFCASVGSGESHPVIRAWIHTPTAVLGIQDAKLPYIEQGIAFLEQNGYQTIIRNSGGLAVILDEGIFNLSLILPEKNGIKINRGYEAMKQLIELTLAKFNVPIEAKEIVGSYCPGSYDLSIGNKKFAGIAQRRLRGGVAVQIYLCITGSGSKRAEIIQNFYRLSLQNEQTKFTFPKIVPSTMASLAELLDKAVTAERIIELLLGALKQTGSTITTTSSLNKRESELFHFNYERIVKRNEKAW